MSTSNPPPIPPPKTPTDLMCRCGHRWSAHPAFGCIGECTGAGGEGCSCTGFHQNMATHVQERILEDEVEHLITQFDLITARNDVLERRVERLQIERKAMAEALGIKIALSEKGGPG